MSENINIKRIQRGPFLKLLINILSTRSNSEIVTDNFLINNLAWIRIKLKFTSGFGNDKVCIHISSMKHKMADESTVRINVRCKDLKFSKESVCSEDWLAWSPISDMNVVSGRKIETEISIYAYKVETMGFTKLYDDTDLTDFDLHADGGSVSVHKVCLAARSETFKSMLTGQWKEAKEDRIQLKDVTVETLRHLKDYIYLGVLPKNDNLRPLLVLAARYFIDDLKTDCVRELAATVEPEQLVSLHKLACEYNIPELSIAISQLTADEVIDKAYSLSNSALDSSNKGNGEDDTSDVK